jgi:hypothetical protein
VVGGAATTLFYGFGARAPYRKRDVFVRSGLRNSRWGWPVRNNIPLLRNPLSEESARSDGSVVGRGDGNLPSWVGARLPMTVRWSPSEGGSRRGGLTGIPNARKGLRN